jgi:hypothetical protein
MRLVMNAPSRAGPLELGRDVGFWLVVVGGFAAPELHAASAAQMGRTRRR